MKVKWTEHRPLHSIPERYWGEDLGKLDSHYEGEVLSSTTNWLGTTFLIVACTDGKVRKCEMSKAKTVIRNRKNREMDDNSIMPFGKFKGLAMIDVPASYLIWLKDNTDSKPVQAYISENMDVLTKQASEERQNKN